MPVDSDDVIDIGDSLLRQYPESFSTSFEENKRQVERLTDLRSKRVRNRIAGYITRNVDSNED